MRDANAVVSFRWTRFPFITVASMTESVRQSRASRDRRFSLDLQDAGLTEQPRAGDQGRHRVCDQ